MLWVKRHPPVALLSKTKSMIRRNAGYREEAHGIFSVPLYTANFCDSITSRIRRLRWTVAEVQLETDGGGPLFLIRKRTRAARILNSPRAPAIYEKLESEIRRIVTPLIQNVWRVRLDQIVGTQLVRYGAGGRYVAHTDAGGDLADRYFSLVCYLNDDFTGGNTSFPGLGFSARPEKGKAIIFPSRYLHSAETVTKGEKFVLITWLCGPVPINWI